MRDAKKKLNSRGFGKYSHSKEQTKLDSLLRFKTSSTKLRRTKHKSKSNSCKLKVGSNTSLRTVPDSCIKGPIKDASNKKLIIRQNMHKREKVSLSSREEGKGVYGEVKMSKHKRRRRDNTDLDEAPRLQRRTRYLLIKMKLEQNLVDAYSGEGWKGQSREKIRPEKELQRAKKQILKCKLGIRDALRQLESLSSVGSIEDSAIAPDGSIYHEHIFCAICKLHEAFPDNDIILCDGTCNRAFHQRCLDPPLDTENIPPGDQGWFCKFCECKMEILEATNAHLGTQFSLDSTWQDVFKEEADIPDGATGLLNPEEEWPSDDPEDDDYNPDRRGDSHSINAEGTDSTSSTSLWSLNGEYSPVDEGFGHEYLSVNGCIGSNESGEIIYGRRQRRAVDYKKLYDEMFKDAPPCEQVSEDEDWGPGKRKRRVTESDAANTLMTLHDSDNKYPNNENNDTTREGSRKHMKRPCFRIPHDALEKLRQVFAENELPPRSVRDDLSKELGIDAAKVNKWFKNARYFALKARKLQVEGGGEQPQSIGKTSKDSRSQNVDKDAFLKKSRDPKITAIHSGKNGKNVDGREKTKSSNTSHLKKKQPEISPPKTRVYGNKGFNGVNDDVSLKKLLKERKRKVDFFILEGESKEAEMEFERLGKLKTKLDSIKQKLTQVQSYRGKGSNVSSCSNEPYVIYVPIAKLKEKV